MPSDPAATARSVAQPVYNVAPVYSDERINFPPAHQAPTPVEAIPPPFPTGECPVPAQTSSSGPFHTRRGGPTNIEPTRVKREEVGGYGGPTPFPCDNSARRTYSLESSHVKTEPMATHPSILDMRRQMSAPHMGNNNVAPNFGDRRSSEPTLTTLKPFPRHRPLTHQMSNPFPTPHPSMPPHGPADMGQNGNWPNLYFVNLRNYHHYQQMENLKRQEMTKGKTILAVFLLWENWFRCRCCATK